MILLVSGEGPSDIGVSRTGQNECKTAEFMAGPLTWLIDQLIEAHPRFGYSLMAAEAVYFVSKQHLAAAERPKTMRLPGIQTPKETGYYYNNAYALASYARQLSARESRPVIAVLFRDADGTASAGRGEWQQKHQSMLDGYQAANYAANCIPMLAKPKSEAWLLCACKPDAYQHCEALESRSGNDNSPHSLKAELQALLADTSSAHLALLAHDRRIDAAQIDMPSFNCFKQQLHHALTHHN